MLVCDAVNALQLVCVPGGYVDLVGDVLAVPIDPRQVLHGAESYLVEYYGVLAVVVELGHIWCPR